MANVSANMNDQPITTDMVRAAMKRGELFYSYQPKTSFESGRLVGAEALIRWRSGDSMISPGRFIPLVEENGMAPELFEHMIPNFLEDRKRMRAQGIDIPVSINVSPEDLKVTRPTEMLHELIVSGEVSGSDIQVEITEGVVLVDDSKIKMSMKQLLSDGVQILMDDFGTGYSSIDVLSKFPYSYVKIDMGLVSRMASNLKSYRIIKGILHLTRDLNILTVAEGVESLGDYQALQLMGCDEAQGFFIAPGLPVEDFIVFAEDHQALPGTLIGTLFSLQASLADYRKSIVGTMMCHFSDAANKEVAVTELEIEHDPQSSRFGKWYYGPGNMLNNISAFADIEEPHRAMREVGLEIVESAYKGRHDFAGLLTLLERFNSLGNQVDGLMGRLIESYLAQEKLAVSETVGTA